MTNCTHAVSVVIPVYQGAQTLPHLFAELDTLIEANTSPNGNIWRVREVVCVYDHGYDQTPQVLRELAEARPWLKLVWLSRNFGQHPATLAGISASGGDWVVTIDEDGQQDPRDIGILLDTALEEHATLVYARPLNNPPHGFLRNLTSRTAKKIVNVLMGSKNSTNYNSFRLILGEVARSASAYAGSGVYLDVALGWVAKVTTAGIHLREEGSNRQSGYSYRNLIAHFWRMVMSSGTGFLRIVSFLGAFTAFVGILLAIIVFINKLVNPDVQIGWSSTIIVILSTSGLIMLSLGVIAEYVGVAVNMAMGRPLYLVTSDPHNGPLGRGKQDNGDEESSNTSIHPSSDIQ
ncbi:glycosyltransferase [Arcanobacterium bovis]|uniref:Glycosyltransferase n=1 Tax=Arcanobacterium bovis TaxID=2529275 RepID=A0A4Q9V1X6_9ACTO|nr:glycosyltransferase [Arcanobacterium bovis]TBW23631.1 glycosyltransferase [Arcanobacterium bovis]